MRKEITICFRATEELRSALEAFARQGRRTLSSAVELILTDYVKKNDESSDKQERRLYPRKHAAIPAYVKTGGSEYGAVIIDLSLGGIRVSVPGECVSRIYEGPGKSQFETSFTLPGGTVTVLCEPGRVMPSNGNVDVGATFIDADFANYQCIQQYLM